MEDVKKIHLIVVKVENPYGMRMLGFTSYMMNHTPGGSQQFPSHYIPDFSELGASPYEGKNLTGSVGDHPDLLQSNPFEMGLGRVVGFNHDFVGKKALLKFRHEQTRTMVSLEWNADDVADV